WSAAPPERLAIDCAKSAPDVLELEVCMVEAVAETAIVDAEVPPKNGLEGCSALTELMTCPATLSSADWNWPMGPVDEERLSRAPSCPPEAEVNVWGHVTVLPLISGVAASPKLTVTEPSLWLVTEICARDDRSSSRLSRWSSRALGVWP